MRGKKPTSSCWLYIGCVRSFLILKSMAYVPNFSGLLSR